MNYGEFSENGKEFIINNVGTPTPWINYIYNDEYFSTISNNAGGISYFKNPLHGRITRYRINEVPPDRPGKYVYIKDKESKEYWSLSWQPVGKYKDSYKTVHGFGYTKIESFVNNILAEGLFFVPLDDNREIWKVIIKNNSNNTRKLSLYAYVEFALGHGLIDLINQCDDQHFNRVYFDKGLNTLFATKTYWVTKSNGTQQQENQEWDQWAFFTVNIPVVQYETLRERFIGNYRTESNPLGLELNELSCKDTDYGNAVGVLRVDVELEPNEIKEIIFSLGVIPKKEFNEKKEQTIRRYSDSESVNDAFLKVRDKWEEFINHTCCNTPDKDINIFMNNWIPYQAKVAFDIGRVASFYYWGISRGFGFRDTAQDTIAVTIAMPEKAKERILLLSRQMFKDGRVYHHFYNDSDGELTKHCDDPVWYILAVTEYIRETGDIKILNEKVPYVDSEEGTVLSHLYSVVNFIKNILTPRNLPVFGRGDWNDTLDYIGGDDGGESVWAAMFYVAMLNRLIELFEHVNIDYKEIDELKNKIIKSIDDLCWDGEWYIRAFGSGKRKIGSKENKYGKIFINTQTWPVIANLPDKQRLIKALDSVVKYLDTEYGPKICAPAFKEIDTNVGLITRCVAGKKENGGIFCHPITWLIQAEAIMKRGNIAFGYLKKILPNRIDSDIFTVEPYVFSQYITSNEHTSPGKASHSWQTGTAAWMYRIFYDYILGVRSTYNGLLIDPVIPSNWQLVKVERVFRGTRYIIEIHNFEGLESGVKEILVDGEKLPSNIIPVTNKKVCNVVVKMGK
ncbi:glycosyl transferase family 36 [Ignavibacteria bacterium 4148-Me]|uniref:GH36-type glycosyl hydrolase domain-containing protein n=1 Tax=Rosettibacter primus TaxID=3111523 RepID=UPI00336C143E